ncbi:hypothetical protein SERLADRAFT_368985 [Serpula lacrymans var. lacrymans S7.9]|uniref:Major facilitator superfamily (MFS) profile domain-containing protein n=1 Tax=Serpula lacrymans var. lacrymans (strain S7.9) TaxID=578457 RepID=F8NTB6_SERL9|nr:uncharacterized protein SERLADRAFT_368985 [Serpula lacrymans var. lacrymans S7.9]EGO25588.1 hypothetical protein SERLADRAFT_368985 [Serpula lacrymans var. lacrymans S7.9]
MFLASQTEEQKRKARMQMMCLYWSFFLLGWNDGSTGPLLPRIQSVYHVNFTIVSLLFVSLCVVPRDHVLMSGIGSLTQIVAYSLQAAAVPFPVFVIANFINGVGSAVQDAQANGFVAALDDNSKMGYLHAVYGAGALVAPLVSTQFSQLKHWSFHYLISLGISLSNVAFLAYTFRLKKQNDCLAEIGLDSGEENASETRTYRQIFAQKTVHVLAFFILVYVGVEVTLGGWIVSFMIDERGGGPSAGYISSGFFGGLMVGRVVLLWFNRKMGEQRALLVYAVLAIGLELVVWLVPSLIGGAVAVSLVGVLLGPTYPLAVNHAARVLPRWLLTSSIGWIGGFGQAGSAVFPFITGLLASKRGIQTLQPLIVAMLASMLVLWLMVPKAVHRTD